MNGKNMKRVFALLVLAASMMAFPSVSQMFGMGKPAEKITSFEIVTLRLSGMRFTTEYEIVMKDKDAGVVEYEIRYEKDGDKRIPQRQTVCSADSILKLLNDCELVSWDGFHGKHPKNVKDGIMFSLRATVNGDKKIRAEGSENFPNHFRELRDGLHAILSQKN
ncbi:MAG: hypothetical protein J6W55_08310 [Acidaminococcaceae bacterium]|nr:hypothetical protein [Acidaminococcaceae bacterium]